MALQCNIDAKGKRVRLIYGMVLGVAGVVMMWSWAWRAGTVFAWTMSIAVLLGGIFSLFEARAGWCVIRAMGFKTPV